MCVSHACRIGSDGTDQMLQLLLHSSVPNHAEKPKPLPGLPSPGLESWIRHRSVLSLMLKPDQQRLTLETLKLKLQVRYAFAGARRLIGRAMVVFWLLVEKTEGVHNGGPMLCQGACGVAQVEAFRSCAAGMRCCPTLSHEESPFRR